MRCRQAGITLIECLIALAILAVIAILGTPFLGRFMAESRLVAQANTLFAAVQLARASAWRSNVAWALCLTDDGRRCKSGRAGLARGWLVLPNESLATGVAPNLGTAGLPSFPGGLLSPDVALHGSRLAITFRPMSRSGTTATLTLCPSLRELLPRQIVVSQVGRPRLKTVPQSPVCPPPR